MTLLDTMMHFARYTLALYAAYVVLGSLAFGWFIWRRVYATPKRHDHRLQTLRDSDSNAH